MAINFDNGSATLTQEYSENFALINKVAKQAIYNVKSVNPLDWMNKGVIRNGVAIEDAVIQLVEGAEWDADTQDGTNLNKPSYPKIKVQYHQTWNGKQFKTTYSENQFKKVLLAGGDEMDASAKIVANLTESEGHEDYEACKGILTSGITAGNIIKANDASHTDGYTVDADLIKAIKNITDEMMFINNSYVSGNFKTRTPFERIRIIMPYKVYNAMNIDVLASLYNLEKAELNSKISKIDADGNVYVVDEFACLKYTRLYRLTNKFIEDGLYYNYWLTVDRMYGTSNLFKAAYVTIK